MLRSVTYRNLYVPVILMMAGAASGAMVFRTPMALGVGGAALLFATGVMLPKSIYRFFIGSLGVLLLGYAFFGRTFAYLGIPPLFIGEAVLGIGMVAFALRPNRFAGFRHPISWIIVLFCLWGLYRTVPYIPIHGMNALRDAVVWGYAAFAIAIVPFLQPDVLSKQLPAAFSRCVVGFLMWAPIALVVSSMFYSSIPKLPGTDISILSVKAGDAGVHLGGVAAFLLAAVGSRSSSAARSWIIWGVWGMGLLAVGSTTRGGMLAIVGAVCVVTALCPRTSAPQLVRAGAILITALVIVLALDVSFERENGRRTISPRQVAVNTMSIFGDAPRQDQLQGTRTWRLTWWSRIIDYTFHGDYFWTGKGYGINLAFDDGMATSNGQNRNPHNGHMTVLARSGVPGLALWVLLQLGFATTMLLSFLKARRLGLTQWTAFLAWILAYWSAFIINMSFDVFLEGPQGGIWMWCLIGTGIAAMIAVDAEARRLQDVHIRPAPTPKYSSSD